MGKIKIYVNTVRYLRPIQVWSRIKQKFSDKSKPTKVTVNTRAIKIAISELDQDENFISRFGIEEIYDKNEVKLLNQDVRLEFSELNLSALKPLIQFNLQYFEYSIALAARYKETGTRKYAETFIKVYMEYLQADLPYASYVISLQISNILIAMQLFGEEIKEHRKEIDQELYRQYRWLLKHQELHLLGNHYFENLKAIVIASFYFNEIPVCREYLEKLRKECQEQILDDGFHFELSPMYHKIILEDLLRIKMISRDSVFPECSWLDDVIGRMASAMMSLEKGFNRTPLFNDAGDNVAKSKGALFKACERLVNYQVNDRLQLTNAGYYKLYDGDIAILMDAGPIGPFYMPGHGHCDCLSFEVTYQGKPLFVNSGTYAYQDERRKYFRSTRAHNTLMVDEKEQSQCWGEHRVANRIRDVMVEVNEHSLVGSCITADGVYEKRTVRLENGVLSVLDESIGKQVESFLHIPDEYECIEDDEGIIVKYGKDSICSIYPIECSVKKEIGLPYAPEFGTLQKLTQLTFAWFADNKQHGYIIYFEGEKIND